MRGVLLVKSVLAFAIFGGLLLGCQTAPKPDPLALEKGLIDLALLQDPASKGLRIERLDNGLDVVFVELHQAPIATILVAVHSGAMVESPEINGLSHLYEHMFFKGNQALPTQEAYMKRLHELGIVFNGTTSTESVMYFFTLPKENVPAGLGFMRDALLTPLFDPAELTSEIKVVLAEYDRAESTPYFPFYREMMRGLYGDFAGRKLAIGERSSISAATREKMLAFRSQYYVPNNSTLIVVGDVNPQELLPKIKELYAAWPKGADPFLANPLPKVPTLAASRDMIVERDFQNVYAQYVWQGPSTKTPEGEADGVVMHVLAGLLSQSSGAASQHLKDSGLFDSFEVEYEPQREAALVFVGGQTAPERGAKALSALAAEVEKLSDLGAYSDAEIESAKVNLAVASLRDFQDSQGVARELAWWWCVGSLKYRQELVERIKGVTRADLVRVAKRYLIEQPHLKAVLVSKETRAKLGLPAPSAQPLKQP